MAASPQPPAIHATCVAIDGRAILIMGASGAGKSDLALRLIDRGATLVSDDYTTVRQEGAVLVATPPETIAGRMEIRHIGIVNMPYAMNRPVALAIRLEDSPERMPDHPALIDIGGVAVPLICLAGREASAPIKVEHALALHGLKVAAR